MRTSFVSGAAPSFVRSASPRAAAAATSALHQGVRVIAPCADTGGRLSAAVAHHAFRGIDCLYGQGDYPSLMQSLFESPEDVPTYTEPLLRRYGLLGGAVRSVQVVSFVIANGVGIVVGASAGAALALTLFVPPKLIFVGFTSGFLGPDHVPERFFRSCGEDLVNTLQAGTALGIMAASSVCLVAFAGIDLGLAAFRAVMRGVRGGTTMVFYGIGYAAGALVGCTVCAYLCAKALFFAKDDAKTVPSLPARAPRATP